MEPPPKAEFLRLPVRAALGLLWDMIHVTAAHAEDHKRRIEALEKMSQTQTSGRQGPNIPRSRASSRVTALLLVGMALAACSAKPPVAQVLAQCQLDAMRANHTQIPDGEENDRYVQTCMQARGYELVTYCGVYAPVMGARCYKSSK